MEHEETPTPTQDLFALNLTEHAETPRTLVVLHPTTQEPFGPTISMIGAEGRTGRELQRRMQTRRLKSSTKKRLDPEDIEEQGVSFLASLMRGWTGIDWKGAPLEFTHDNARMLLTELLWLRKQVDEFAYNAENFLSGN